MFEKVSPQHPDKMCDRIAALKIIIPKDLVNLYTELRDKYM